MSQPYGQYPPPFPPQGGPMPPQPPRRRDHTVRNVLIGVGVFLLLSCGGLVWGAFYLGREVRDSFDEAFDTEYPGSRHDPRLVAEGDSFEIRDVTYSSGWRLSAAGSEPVGSVITGLRASNDRSTSEYVRLQLDFVADGVTVGSVTCSSEGSLDVGESGPLTCRNYGTGITGYDRVEAFDTSTFE